MAEENTESKYMNTFVNLVRSDMQSYSEESAKDPDRIAKKNQMFENIMSGVRENQSESGGKSRGQQAEERFANILNAAQKSKESEAEY